MITIKRTSAILLISAIIIVLTTNLSVAQGQLLSYGDAVCNTPAQNRNGDTWTFSGSRDDGVTIALFSDDFDPLIELIDPTGKSLKSDDDSAGHLNSLIHNFRLFNNGQYRIRVGSFNGAIRGRYTLILGVDTLGNPNNQTRSRPPSGMALEFERRSAVEFATGGNERWLFAADARDEIVVAMMGNNDGNRALQDPFLEILRGSDNRTLTSDDDSAGGRNALAQFEASAAGQYIIRASSFSTSARGDYTLLMGRCL